MAAEKRVWPIDAMNGRRLVIRVTVSKFRSDWCEFCLLALGVSAVLGSVQHANADWPQLLGAHRNGIAVDETLPSELPDPITPAWAAEVGQGYAGPVVAGDRVWLFHRVGESERLEAFEASTGRRIYRRDFDANYRGGVDADIGPRCVPVVAGNRIILFGAAGATHAVNREDGQPLWTRDLYEEYDGSEGYFGAGSTPLVLNDRIIVNVGGRKSAGVVALELRTGKTIWQAAKVAASYSSPTRATVNGVEQILLVARLDALLIDPQTGTVVARRPFGQRGPTVNAATPLVVNDRAFLTASYGVGATLIDLNSKDLRSVWANDESLSSQYNSPVYRDGYLYGIHGREDMGPAELRCVQLSSGRVAWSQPSFGVAHAILARDRILLLKTDGTLDIIQASPDRFKPLAKTRFASRGKTRALPALSGGCLYVRDSSRLVCLSLL